MEKEYLRCPNCSEGQIYLMEVAGVERGFYICSHCDLVWKRYWDLNVSLASEWQWLDYLKKIGISPSSMKITKKKPLVIVEEENPQPPFRKEYLLCPNCRGGYGIMERLSIKGLQEEIDVCDECDLAWIKGTALQGDGVGLLDEYIDEKGRPTDEKGRPTKAEITNRRRLIIMEEDQV
ncbi:hypothetical protein ACFQ49_02745 [Kroppenstedtia eburnea]|uniref:hypothetical protein n=1 Tax=Kroppenstedtia eburnea TaxID=714067 RepID=UPI00363D6918